MTTVVVTSALAAATIAALASCSGGSQSSLPSSLGANRVGVPAMVSPNSLVAEQPRLSGNRAPLEKDMFVSAYHSVQIVANGTWKDIGEITSGIYGPDGNWVDRKGNLYVANFDGNNITEYAPHSTSPSFTYSGGMTDPVDVRTDGHGNVYEADYNGGFVNEYGQGSNTVVATCSPGGLVESMAIDASGDVFVDYNLTAGGNANIKEYEGGLKGCAGKLLGASVDFAGGMVLDGNGDLVICDQNANAPAVDVIAPPYKSISGTLGSGFHDPFHVTDRQGRR